MKLEFFNAADGDAFLVTSNDRHLLVDGGRKGAFEEHALPHLDAVRLRGDVMDAVCVSHIDADHVTGILALFELLIDWKVFDYHHHTIGHTDFPEPSRWRPPDVGRVWHNGFEAQTGMDARDPTRLLQAAAVILAPAGQDRIRQAAEACGTIATSIRQGIELGLKLGPEQLNIPRNPEYAGGLMVAEPGRPPLRLGDANLTVLGPTQQQLDDLRDDWTSWVAKNQATVDELNEQSRRDADRLGLAASDAFFELRTERAAALADRADVTIPNLASVMFLVREGQRSAILTGDGFAADVVSALEAEGVLGGDGLHVDVLKVPHHGSEHNSDHTFYETVTADHYVIPSDGSHHNPDLRVVEDILASRVGSRAASTRTPQAGDPFTIWITASTDGPDTEDTTHLRDVRRLLTQWRDEHPANVRFNFLADSSFVLALD